MKKQITFLLLFCSKLLFSQEESKEEFFNQVYKDFIPEDYEYFYLEPPYIPSANEFEYAKEKPFYGRNSALSNDAEGVIKAIEKRKKNPKSSYWDFQAFKKARECFQDSLLPSFDSQDFVFTKRNIKDKERFVRPHTFFVTVKWYWSKKRREKEAWKVYKKLKELIYRPEKLQCFTFSEPIFFDGGNKAYFSFRKSDKEIDAVYKKENGIWKKDYYSSVMYICGTGIRYTTYTKEKHFKTKKKSLK